MAFRSLSNNVEYHHTPFTMIKIFHKPNACLHILLALMMMVFLPQGLLARDIEYTYEGQTLTYTVLDEDNKTVETKGSYDYAVNNIRGKVVIPDKIVELGIEYTVTRIGGYSFKERGITDVTIPNSVTSIGDRAFYNCSSITGIITIPNKVEEIGENCFSGCSGLTAISIEDGTSPLKIGKDALYKVPIKSLYIGRDYIYEKSL